MNYTKILGQHKKLSERNERTEQKVNAIRNKFSNSKLFENRSITIYCAGSLGRGDIGSHSDLDLFLLSGEKKSRLKEVEMLAAIININRDLNYQEFSNDGRYLKIYDKEAMLKAVGHPRDDSENLFTARMLMLLESRAICNDLIYEEYLDSIIEHYFRDSRGKQSFRPLFLINDILRYWRTLCLNYEQIRDEPNKPWGKKNINLKFSRMLTVFGTILPIVTKPVSKGECIKELTGMSPNQRLAFGLDCLKDNSLIENYKSFLDNYETFLSWKEKMGSQNKLDDHSLIIEAKQKAQEFSDFLYQALSNSAINNELRKYLVL